MTQTAAVRRLGSEIPPSRFLPTIPAGFVMEFENPSHAILTEKTK